MDCVACPSGAHLNASAGGCVVCAAGQYDDDVAAAAVFGLSSAVSPCVACPAGRVQALAGQTQCVVCGAGSVTDTLNMTGGVRCTACVAGQYSAASTVAC